MGRSGQGREVGGRDKAVVRVRVEDGEECEKKGQEAGEDKPGDSERLSQNDRGRKGFNRNRHRASRTSRPGREDSQSKGTREE